METAIYLRCTIHEVKSIFNKGINEYAEIRWYSHNGDNRAKVILRHSDKLEFKENAAYSIKGLMERCNPVRKYHIITFSNDSGEDDKGDYYTFEEAMMHAKEYMQDAYFEWVRVFCKHKIVAELLK